MRHKFWVIILTCVVAFVALTICFKELFSVKDITVTYTVKDEECVEEVVSLLDKYRGKFMLFLNTEKIKEDITEDRYLKVSGVKKVYPNEIVVSLVERTELFYYEAADGFYYFDEEFFVTKKTTDKPDAKLHLTGISFTDKAGKENVTYSLKSHFTLPREYNEKVLKCISYAGDNYTNLANIRVVFMPEKNNVRLYLTMTEGVEIVIERADERFDEKIKAGFDFYLGLEENRKIKGQVIVNVANGKIKVVHTFNKTEL